jgi:hypothetical protein
LLLLRHRIVADFSFARHATFPRYPLVSKGCDPMRSRNTTDW